MTPAAMQKERLVHDRQTLFVKERETGVPGYLGATQSGTPGHNLYLKCSIIVFSVPSLDSPTSEPALPASRCLLGSRFCVFSKNI